MKHLIFSLLFLVAATAVAQPPARRKAAETEKQEKAVKTTTGYREFPVAQTMPTDAAWRRDIYRQLNLTKDANAVLYYPTTPQEGQMNLFTYLFRLILRGQVKAYEYTLDMNPHFTEDKRVKARKIMDDHQIFYESKDDKIRVNDADLPSEEVKCYFIKESIYYDQHTASFRTKVTAICPVLTRGDEEFGGSDSRYPMFWVKYEDAAPYLGKLMLMGSNLNNAAMMSADDYFTLNLYDGEIYKTTNLQDKLISNYCPTDSAVKKERVRIEKELTDFQNHVWGHDSVAVDSAATDSASLDEVKEKKSSVSRRSTPTRRGGAKTTTSSKKTKSSSTKVKSSEKKPKAAAATKRQRSSSGSGTYSVRRERH